MHHDRIDRILHFVAHSRRESSDCSHSARKFKFRFNLFDRLEIVKRHQGPKSHARVIVVDEVNRGLNTPARFRLNFFLHQRDPRIERVSQRPAQHRRVVEDLPRLQAENVVSLKLKKSTSGLRHQHRTTISREEQNPVLKVAEDLIQVLLQGREDFLDIAHALADLFDLGRDAFRRIQFRRLLFLELSPPREASSSRAAC